MKGCGGVGCRVCGVWELGGSGFLGFKILD